MARAPRAPKASAGAGGASDQEPWVRDPRIIDGMLRLTGTDGRFPMVAPAQITAIVGVTGGAERCEVHVPGMEFTVHETDVEVARLRAEALGEIGGEA